MARDHSSSDSERWDRGASVYARRHHIDPSEVSSFLSRQVGPRLAEEAIYSAGGHAWDSRLLSPREQSLIVLASLATRGAAEQPLRSHIRAALDNGLTPEELETAICLLAIYAGFPRAVAAMGVLREELESQGRLPPDKHGA